MLTPGGLPVLAHRFNRDVRNYRTTGLICAYNHPAEPSLRSTVLDKRVGQDHAALTGGGLAGGSPSGARSGSFGGTSSGGGDGSGSLVGGGASGSISGGIGVCRCRSGMQRVFVIVIVVSVMRCV